LWPLCQHAGTLAGQLWRAFSSFWLIVVVVVLLSGVLFAKWKRHGRALSWRMSVLFAIFLTALAFVQFYLTLVEIKAHQASSSQIIAGAVALVSAFIVLLNPYRSGQPISADHPKLRPMLMLKIEKASDLLKLGEGTFLENRFDNLVPRRK